MCLLSPCYQNACGELYKPSCQISNGQEYTNSERVGWMLKVTQLVYNELQLMYTLLSLIPELSYIPELSHFIICMSST